MFRQRLHTANRSIHALSTTTCRCQSTAALRTLARRTPTIADPTTTATPAQILKIQSRTAQVAHHLSASPSSQTRSSSTMAPTYGIRTIGAPHTLEHRIYIEKDGVPVSSFHDIPLYANEQKTVMNMIVEIPRWSNAKQEVCDTFHRRRERCHH